MAARPVDAAGAARAPAVAAEVATAPARLVRPGLSNSRTGPRRVSSFTDQSVNRPSCIITRPITVISSATGVA